ncbi:MAG: hypothetical protein F2840_12695, partial [Actinobacteria bacterium]|nr:hypothetical protein [Actinomycetota bacterium]
MTTLVPIAVLACVLSACGSSAPEPSGASASALSGVNTGTDDAASSQDSYPLPDCTGQDPANCSYDGFDPSVDGFSFANWGETGELDATGMVALFGAKAVCAKRTSSGCVLYPAAREWAEQVNEAMAGGHCEGMAVMAARLFRGDAQLADLDPDAESTFDLAFEDPDVAGAIDLWWSTQMLAPVQEAYMAFHDYQPSEIAAELAVGLQTGEGYTMGIYSPDGAHAITPFAVTQEGDRIAISVYDNNFPGTVQRIMIDPATEQWSYAMGSTNPDEPTGGWEGGIGTIELTPMASRGLPVAAPFDDSASKGAVRGNTVSHLLVTSPDPQSRVGFDVTVDGQTYDTTDPAVVLPEGVMARSTLGAVLSGKGMAVTVDRSVVKSFSASPRARNGSSGQTPVTMSIDSVGSPRITVRAASSEATEADTSFTVNRRGQVEVASADGSQADVNVSNGLNSVDFPLPDDIDMTVDTGGDGVADIEYLDEDGNVVGEFAVDDETENGDVIDALAEFDEDSGEFDLSEDVAEADEVDQAALDAFAGDGSADDYSGADAQDDSDADAQDDSDAGAQDDSDAGAQDDSDAGAQDDSDAGA